MRDDQPLSKDLFESYNFALNNKELFDRFIDLTIKGTDQVAALRLVFGDAAVSEGQGITFVFAIMRNQYYIEQFAPKLEAMPVKEIWNVKEAVHQLATIAKDKFAKEAARIKAIENLNVITGITTVDDGTTRAGRGLDEFYKEFGLEPINLNPNAPKPH